MKEKKRRLDVVIEKFGELKKDLKLLFINQYKDINE